MPAEFQTFSVPDDFDPDCASADEIRAEYVAWERRVCEWDARHRTRSVAELLADPAAMADVPFNPHEELAS